MCSKITENNFLKLVHLVNYSMLPSHSSWFCLQCMMANKIMDIILENHLLASRKLVDVHLESVLQPHVDVVGLPAVHRVPQQRDKGGGGKELTDLVVVPNAIR